MKVDTRKLKQLSELLEECLDLNQQAIELDDNEIGTDIDIYDKLQVIIEDINGII